MVSGTELGIPPPVVAVVDDDEAVCNSLKFALELEGFSIRTYASGAELLRSSDIAKCDCFVVDEKMPGMNGLDVIAEIRHRHISAPAILIISQPNARVSARAAKSHVPIVEKPLLGNALVDKIRQACGQS
ncbi:MAG TPA: response regulator [Xanthobacteraceae bacterium]|nr:response regulator [Xanthobacteraceae bacterium]